MGLYLLPLLAAVLAVTLAVLLALAGFRLARRLATLARFTVRCGADATPGEPLSVSALVRPRGGRVVSVEATLTCTMFDSRAHRLYERTLAMAPAGEDVFAASLQVPSSAPRSGVVGDDLSTLFSEEARRLLVAWTVSVTVRSARGTVLARRVVPVEMRAGRPLATTPEAVARLVGGAFAELREELLFNWLVTVAARDGTVAPRERALLHQVLREAHGVADPSAADARIAEELGRGMAFEGSLFRRHVSPATRLAFCRLLYAVAWRDGALHREERSYLADRICELGLSRNEVLEAEMEVVRGVARHSLA